MINSGYILLVDDEEHVLRSTAQTLEIAGFTVTPCSNARDALSKLDRRWPGLIISDLRMPKMDGIELMHRCHLRDSDVPFILLSGHADIADAVNAIRDGAYDFLEKPYHRGRLIETARRAQNHRTLILENRRLSIALEKQIDSAWLGNSLASQLFRDKLRTAAKSEQAITLHGEQGTGKSLAADISHRLSSQTGRKIQVDCHVGSIKIDWPKNLSRAENGTLVLKHIDRASPVNLDTLNQSLKALTIQKPRLIATSRSDLIAGQDKQPMPLSLYYELTQEVLIVPPLRSRAEDIPILLRHFLNTESKKLDRAPPNFGSHYLAELMTHDWPGNTRELKHISDKWFSHQQEPQREGAPSLADTSESILSLPERMAQFEKKLIEHELAKNAGDVKSTYLALGIPRKTLYDKLAKHDIKRARDINKRSSH